MRPSLEQVDVQTYLDSALQEIQARRQTASIEK
jgi:hypothetical protein